MKKILSAALVFVLAISMLTACGGDDESKSSGNGSDNSTNSTASLGGDNTNPDNVKNDGYEKFSKLKIGMNKNEVNDILGEPVKEEIGTENVCYYYKIRVNGKDMEVEVWISKGDRLVTYFGGDFFIEEYRAEFADSATDLSNANDLKSGKIATYDDCVSAFKTPGYLINIDEWGIKGYIWVNTDNEHVRITFSAGGKIKDYSGLPSLIQAN